MSIIEINFKCENCGQEFWDENFNISAFLYGVFLLFGKEKEYVGLTCPKCLKTILIKDNSDLVNYTKQNLLSGEMSFLIYLVRDEDDNQDMSQSLVSFYPKLRYHSSVKHNPKQIQEIKHFDIPYWSGPLTNNLEDELSHYMGENPQLQEKYLCPYIPYGEPPMGPYFSVWWFREDQIDDLVEIENKEDLRIFPRYIHKISEIENIELFCWENHLYLNHLIEQKREAEETIEKLKEIAKQQNTNLQEILEANFGVITPEMVEFMINQYVENEKERKVKLSTNFVEILTAEPSPLELPITDLSLYEFLWKTPHPFEDNGLPRSLINVDPAQFKKPKKTFAFDEIAGEVPGHFGKGYGLNFINENYEVFIKEYIELAQSSYFSYALVWELKVEYLRRLHEQMHKEALLEARYAFFSEGLTWTITFDGITLRGLRGKGFEYIYYLVCNKFKDYSHEDINQLDGIEVYHIGRKKSSSPKGSSQTSTKKKGMIDHKAMIYGKSAQEIKRKYKELKESLEDAKREENPIEIKMAQEEYDQFSKFSYEYFNRHGRVKKFQKKQKNIRDKIAKNIKEAKDEIEKNDLTHNKRIWNHFNDALGGLYRQSIVYRPSEDINWHT